MKTSVIANQVAALSGVVLVMGGSLAEAHEGHHEGDLANGIWHLLTQPDHWILLAGLVGTGVLVAAALRRRSSRKAEDMTN